MYFEHFSFEQLESHQIVQLLASLYVYAKGSLQSAFVFFYCQKYKKEKENQKKKKKKKEKEHQKKKNTQKSKMKYN